VAVLTDPRDDVFDLGSTFEFKPAAHFKEKRLDTAMPGCDVVLLKNTRRDPGRDTKQRIMVNLTI